MIYKLVDYDFDTRITAKQTLSLAYFRDLRETDKRRQSRVDSRSRISTEEVTPRKSTKRDENNNIAKKQTSKPQVSYFDKINKTTGELYLAKSLQPKIQPYHWSTGGSTWNWKYTVPKVVSFFLFA